MSLKNSNLTNASRMGLANSAVELSPAALGTKGKNQK